MKLPSDAMLGPEWQQETLRAWALRRSGEIAGSTTRKLGEFTQKRWGWILASAVVVAGGMGFMSGMQLSEAISEVAKQADIVPPTMPPAEATPPPPKIVPEEIEIEKPKFAPRPGAVIEPSSPASEAPAPPHHVSKDTYDLAARNLDSIAYNTLIPSPTDTQVQDFQAAMHARGIDMSDAEAKQALENGGFESRGATYEIWHSDATPSNFIATEVHGSHWLNGNVAHIDTPPPAPDAAPAEFSDSDKAQYQKFTEASVGDSSFHPTPDHYQEAALSRDGTFGSAEAMRDASHTLNGYTTAEIATQQPPTDASPEVKDAWLKMQAWLNGEAAHIPHATDSTQHISAYLLSIGMIG